MRCSWFHGFFHNIISSQLTGRCLWRGAVGALLLCVALQLPAWAAASLQGVRFHSGNEHDRIVFDLSEMPLYTVRASEDGRRVTIDFTELGLRHFHQQNWQSSRVQAVGYAQKQGHFLVTLQLKAGLTYKVANLHQPARVFIDVLPAKTAADKVPTQGQSGQAEQAKQQDASVVRNGNDPLQNTVTADLAPGLQQKSCVYWDEDGKISAWFIIADHNRYRVRPALGQGRIPGCEALSGISDRYDAVAAINASYFNWNGDLIGVTKIDGSVVGTTYYARSAFGIMPDGRSVFGTVSYEGEVTLGRVTQPVAGVDCERGADSLVLYNRYYGKTTRTNEYGREYVVRNGRVTAIGTGNTPIPSDGWVVSVHGKVMDACAGVKVGDAVSIMQELGTPWDEAVQVLGVGPRLLQAGRVHVTASEEQFPGDIRYGRAPRSAIGVLANGDYILGVVDGRQASSHGLTLTEWAQLLQRFGAVDAINFDGGGSSELIAGGNILNSPSDGHERPVGAALLVFNK